MWTVTAIIAAGIGGFTWMRARALQPPEMDLSGVDPAVVLAIDSASRSVRAWPFSSARWGRLGMILLAHEFNGPADRCFRRAEQLDGTNPRWPYFQGVALAQEHPEEALPKFRRTVEISGDQPPSARLRSADILLTLGRIDEAEAEFSHVLQIQSDNPYAILGLGKVALARGHFKESTDHFGKAASDDRTRKQALTLLAATDERLGRHDAAQRESRDARALPKAPPPDDAFLDEAREFRTGKYANFDRADAMVVGGRLSEAVALLEQTARDYADAEDAWRKLGETRLAANDPIGAEAAFQKGVSLNPSYPETQNDLGLALLRQKRFAESELCFRRAVDLDPDHAEAHFNLGLSLRNQARYAAAEMEFRTAVGLRPELGSGYYQLAIVLNEERKFSQAKEQVNRAIELDPGNENAHALLKRLTSEPNR